MTDSFAPTPLSESRRSRGGHRPQKTAMLLAQRIVEEITTQHLDVGALLPSEREMLALYGVARGTLREALRLLESQGVLSIKPGPGGGPRVNGADARSLGGSISLLLQLRGASFSTVVEARLLLEPAMAELAARNATKADLATMRATLEAMADGLPDVGTFLDENRRFHDAIATASRNALFELLLESLGWIMDATTLGVEYDSRRRRSVVNAHQSIYDAIEAGDSASAGDAMRRHMDEFARYLHRYYASVLDQPLRWDMAVI